MANNRMAQKVFKHTKDNDGFEAARRYADKLRENGFVYSYHHPSGGTVYYHRELLLEVLVYVQ
ncbi:MAG: hypothetical protein NC548_32090 [Lachnospiraceae bacterium]|nr:hypothetical protein [Lachnospiraceae bacterium]